jgi:hypothetical protein
MLVPVAIESELPGQSPRNCPGSWFMDVSGRQTAIRQFVVMLRKTYLLQVIVASDSSCRLKYWTKFSNWDADARNRSEQLEQSNVSRSFVAGCTFQFSLRVAKQLANH